MDLNKKIWQWTALLTLSFIWGASFILIKKSLLAFTPYQSGALRISFAFLFFLPLSLNRLKKIKKENIKQLLIVGFIGNFFPAFLFAYGETIVTSTLASMLNSTTPIFVLIVGLILYRTKAKWQNVLGITIGFLGTLGLIVKSSSSVFSGWNIGAVIILIATFFYGINTNEIKFKLNNLDGISVSSLSFLFIGPVAIFYLLSSDVHSAYVSEFFWESMGALLILAFFGSFIAVIIFNTLIKFTTPIFAASVTYLIPIFAIGWGLIDGEYISIVQVVSILIVLAGVSLVNKKDNPVVKIK
ncbi:MAG: DMT family transporter [Bacteroidales bacterium]|nr:DMT family transporter [Bacteroidales bacterium]